MVLPWVASGRVTVNLSLELGCVGDDAIRYKVVT